MIDIEKIKSKIKKIAEKYDIKFVVLFGSQADLLKILKKDSDFDVAVFLKGKRAFFADANLYGDLLNEFSKLFNVDDSIKIDLTDLGRANILLRYEITSNGLLLYGDGDEYAQFRAFAFRDYHDARPLFALESFLIKKRQRLIKEALV
jgi:predicted nucleotidyltransferase